MSYKRDLLWVSISQYAGYLFPLFITPILARSLGTESFGIYSISLAYITTAMTIAEFGINNSCTRLIAISTTTESHKIFTAAITVRLFFFCIAIIALIINLKLSNATQLTWDCTLASIPMLIGCTLSTTWFLQGKGYSRISAWPNVAARFTILPVIFLTVKSPKDVILASALMALPFTLASIINGVQSVKIGAQLTPVGISSILTVLKESAPIFATLISIQIYTNIILTYAASTLSVEEISNYTAADRVIKLFFAIIAPLTTVILPLISQQLKNSKSPADHLKKILLVHILIAIFFSSGCILFANQITSVLFGSNFKDAAEIIRKLSVLPILSAISHTIGTHGLIASGQGKKFLYTTISGAITSIATGTILIDTMKTNGLILTSIITEICVILVAAMHLKKVLKEQS
ncbi:oligosaccharide flippase family protein [Burkholderiaceae bacterium DAT-1]|nr:oligosaccharide flippase family protein [Burkholderiaceae bacterium DAT-1]